WFRCNIEPSYQTSLVECRYEIETQTVTALIPTGREERIEGLAPDIEAHAATVVRKTNLNAISADGPDLDVDETCLAVGKGMQGRIEEEIGQHLPVRAGIAVHRQIGGTFDGEGEILLSQPRTQAHDDLFGQIAQIEGAMV